MATFEPDPELFARQVSTLRDQTHRNWICVISDDASSRERHAEVERVVGDDPRFTVSRSDRRLGFYRNFERALTKAPREARFVAFADQDDRWDIGKLATLVAAIGGARLVYSDARAVRPDGTLISETLWRGRRNNRTNFASLLLTNTVTGAASMFRRELLDLVLPFPETPGTPYHDHWTALVARATGELAYVDRTLFDYVQHPKALLGHEAIEARPRISRPQRLRRLARDPAAALDRWREAYEDEWCRTVAFARELRERCGERLQPRDRRALDLVLAGERSPRTWAWLAVRPLRGLAGRNETKGFEHRLLRGLIWRKVAFRWTARTTT
ncbi:MAG TPA: glycosyltransferase [Solirubrobacterales bacterium]|nr:glycosyltransferase [Solirubrobacterales bacterium]